MNIEIDMDRIHEAVKQAVLDGMGFAVREEIRHQVLTECKEAFRAEIRATMKTILETDGYPTKDGTYIHLRDYIVGWMQRKRETDYSNRPNIQCLIEELAKKESFRLLEELLLPNIDNLKATIKKNVVQLLLSKLE